MRQRIIKYNIKTRTTNKNMVFLLFLFFYSVIVVVVAVILIKLDEISLCGELFERPLQSKNFLLGLSHVHIRRRKSYSTQTHRDKCFRSWFLMSDTIFGLVDWKNVILHQNLITFTFFFATNFVAFFVCVFISFTFSSFMPEQFTFRRIYDDTSSLCVVPTKHWF